jgi:hypothetical protein
MSAANAPSVAKLAALVATFQAKITTFRTQQPAAPMAQLTAPLVFANTPQKLEVENLIYVTKRGAEIYKQGCAPLEDKSLIKGFNLTTNQTVTFAKAFRQCCTEMGWNTGNKNITSFVNKEGTP